MKIVIIFLSIISLQHNLTTQTSTDEPVPIETRIDLLKRELLDEIHKIQPASDRYSDMYEYVDNSNKPITPISIYDKRKLHGRFKLPELKSTTTEKFIASDTSSDEKKDKPLRSKTHKTYKIAKQSKPLDIFYRKSILLDDEERHKPQKWAHCLDLITPYLNGYKNNMTNPQRIDENNLNIIRLSHLMNLNVTDFTHEDIRSILYEISNLELRLYQWDMTAMRTIFNVIIQDGTHDFRGLKHGIKRLMASWKLDTSNIMVFFKQFRILRPPCLQVSEYGGSTKTTGGVRYYTKPSKKPNSDEVY